MSRNWHSFTSIAQWHYAQSALYLVGVVVLHKVYLFAVFFGNMKHKTCFLAVFNCDTQVTEVWITLYVYLSLHVYVQHELLYVRMHIR